MQPPDMHPAFERFHSPLELPDSWPGSELAHNGGSIHCSTTANPCPSDVAGQPMQPCCASQQEQTSLHQQMKSTEETPGSDAGTKPGTSSCEAKSACFYAADGRCVALRVPSHSQTSLQSRSFSSPRKAALDTSAGASTHPRVQRQQKEQAQTAPVVTPIGGGFRCSPSLKSRSISQPRSVRDLVPRLTSARRLVSLPFSLGFRGPVDAATNKGAKVSEQKDEPGNVAQSQASQPKTGETAAGHASGFDAQTTDSPAPDGLYRIEHLGRKASCCISIEPSKMLLWLLAIGGAFCITLSCVAAVASLITASKLAETPVLFLQKKSPHLQGWEAQTGPPLKQQAGDRQSSSLWLDDADSSMIAPTKITEKKHSASFPGMFSFDAATTGRGTADTEAAFIFSGSPPKRFGIGSLRDLPLAEIAASVAILLKPRPEEERLFRVEEAARNMESKETLLSLSQGYALVLKQDLGLLLSPHSSVLAAWQLPFPSTPNGVAVALSPQQLQEKLQAAALHAADHSKPPESAAAAVDLQRENEDPSRLGERGTAGERSESRPPPHSELDYELLDAGEPLLSGYVVLPEAPETLPRKVTRVAKDEGRPHSTSSQGTNSSDAALAS
ncbi:hypothetical protein Esti_003061 [Eimeria stiedai]